MQTDITYDNLFVVGDADFVEKVLRSSSPVIVDFTAEWCAPCRVLAPLYARLSAEYKGRLCFAKMDIDAHQHIPGRLYVQGAPTLILFKDGQEVERIVGPHPARLKQLIERMLAQHSTH